MGCESCKGDREQVHMTAETARVVADMTAKQDRTMKVVLGLWVATVLIMAAAFMWTVSNIQRVANEAVLTALETVAELEVTSETITTTTNTTEVAQDTGEGGGNNVYLDGDGTTYNEAGGNS